MSTLRRVSVNWIAFVFTAVVGFFLSPYIVHRLGNTGYGIWALVSALFGYMGLLDLGVRSAVMRFVSRYHAMGDNDGASQVASTGLTIFALLGVVGLTASIVMAAFIIDRFQIPDGRLWEARVVLLMGGLGFGVSLLSGVFGGVLSALERFDLSGLIDIATTAVRAALVVALLFFTSNLIALAATGMVASVIRIVAQQRAARRCYPELRIAYQRPSSEWTRRIFSFGLFSSLIYVSRTLIFSTDSIVIGAFLPAAAITFFAIPASLTDYARSVINSIAVIVSPRASALQAQARHEELAEFSLRYAKLATLMALPIAVTFMIRGARFIELWMGREYGERSGQVLLILAIAFTLWAGHQVLALVLIGLNRHRTLAVAYLGEGLANVGISAGLIGAYGIVGVAWGTAIPSLVTSLIVAPALLMRELKVRWGKLVFEVWVRPLVSILLFGAATLLVERHWSAPNLVLYFLQVALCLPVAGLGAWVVALTPVDRTVLARAVTHAVRKLKGPGE